MKSIPPGSPRDEPKSARLFRNGVNQAIRIPREFELPGSDVTIRRVGSALLIEPIQKMHPRGSPAALLAALATLKPITDPFPNVDDGVVSLDDVLL